LRLLTTCPHRSTVTRPLDAEAAPGFPTAGPVVPAEQADPDQMDMWFADPADDDCRLGPDSALAPFEGDDEAGMQAFDLPNTNPLPLP
jgi:hypothetical protein